MTKSVKVTMYYEFDGLTDEQALDEAERLLFNKGERGRQVAMEVEDSESDVVVQRPVDKTALGCNQWNKDSAAFVAKVQAAPYMWLMDMELKYLNVRIDTRDGAFLILDKDKKRISPDRVLKAIAASKERFKNNLSQEAEAPAGAVDYRAALGVIVGYLNDYVNDGDWPDWELKKVEKAVREIQSAVDTVCRGQK